MALTTPIDVTQRGYAANSGVVTTLYPHSVEVDQYPVKVQSIKVHGPDLTTLVGTAVATSDVFKLFPVLKGDFVLSVTAVVTTAEGGTCTFHIGDGTDVDGYMASVNGNSAATSFSWDESPGTIATAFGVGHFYSAADTIDFILATGTLAKAVIDVSIVYIRTLPLTA